MNRDFFLLCSLFLFATEAFCQRTIDWSTLADVRFKEEYFSKDDMYYLTPTFGTSLYTLNNSSIRITGYILNIDPSTGLYLVSKNPMASCFFCGMAGPETIMEVRFAEKPHYKTDQIVTVTGIFKLNGDDIEHCNYILEEASGKSEK